MEIIKDSATLLILEILSQIYQLIWYAIYSNLFDWIELFKWPQKR